MQYRWSLTKGFYIDDEDGTFPIGGVGAPVYHPLRAVTADTTVDPLTDYTIVADGTSNTVTITMPASPNAKQVFNIACLNSAFAVDIDFNGKNFYDSSDNELLFKGENLIVQYDGTQWIGV